MVFAFDVFKSVKWNAYFTLGLETCEESTWPGTIALNLFLRFAVDRPNTTRRT